MEPEGYRGACRACHESAALAEMKLGRLQRRGCWSKPASWKQRVAWAYANDSVPPGS